MNNQGIIAKKYCQESIAKSHFRRPLKERYGVSIAGTECRNIIGEVFFFEITAARLSRGGTDLVLTEGSKILAQYPGNISFQDLMNAISSPYYSAPQPETLNIEAEFFVAADYSVSDSNVIDFEVSDEVNPIDIKGDWNLTKDRAASGSFSLRSKHISHSENSYASAKINTQGGYSTGRYRLMPKNSMAPGRALPALICRVMCP